MTVQPFFAVRVAVYTDDGGSSTRDYVRGEQHIGKAAFAAFALGDMLLTINPDGKDPVEGFKVTEVDFQQVVENRKYHHTTH